MGIFDFFRRKGKASNDSREQQGQEAVYPEMQLKYTDGTNATVSFREVVDYQLENGKSAHLQEVIVTYEKEDSTF